MGLYADSSASVISETLTLHFAGRRGSQKPGSGTNRGARKPTAGPKRHWRLSRDRPTSSDDLLPSALRRARILEAALVTPYVSIVQGLDLDSEVGSPESLFNVVEKFMGRNVYDHDWSLYLVK